MRASINPWSAAGFGLASVFALAEGWSLPEFCWSAWLAGLAYTWTCIATAPVQIILTARSEKSGYEERFPFLRRIPPPAFLLVLTIAGVLAGLLAFRVFGYVFGFYGLFLSFFAEMEPHVHFGRNGFINSDFYSPVVYLLERFWPMVAGVLIANWEDFVRTNPWRRFILPSGREVLRIHLMIVALPFLSLLAWALFRENYQSITVVLLMALFYLLPKKAHDGPS